MMRNISTKGLLRTGAAAVLAAARVLFFTAGAMAQVSYLAIGRRTARTSTACRMSGNSNAWTNNSTLPGWYLYTQPASSVRCAYYLQGRQWQQQYRLFLQLWQYRQHQSGLGQLGFGRRLLGQSGSGLRRCGGLVCGGTDQ